MDNPTNIIIISAIFAGIVIIALLVFFILKRYKRYKRYKQYTLKKNIEYSDYIGIYSKIIKANDNKYSEIKNNVDSNSSLISPFSETSENSEGISKLPSRYIDDTKVIQYNKNNIDEIIDYILGLNYYNYDIPKNIRENVQIHTSLYYLVTKINNNMDDNIDDNRSINKAKFNKMLYTPIYVDSMYILWYYLKIYNKPDDSCYIMLNSGTKFVLIDIKYKIIYHVSYEQYLKYVNIYIKNGNKYELLNKKTGIFSIVDDYDQKVLSKPLDQFIALGEEL